MFSHLNINSRHIIHSLCKDGKATLGAKTVDISNESSREMLALVSINLKSLITLNGKDLVNNVKLLMENFNFENIKNQINDLKYEKTQQAENFKLGKIKVCSFRGLAPLGREWEYDFNCKSHLILGPNGSGKSSLLGAICWCLTGKYFRDDCPPCEPEKITAYPLNDKAGKKIKDRDDAQSLLDENGTCSLIVPYWVEIELIGRTKKLILRRKNVDGLTVKNDGEEWRKITSIKEADIDELDCELRLLMPAKISHIKLGKNPDVLRLLAEITGYGDLEIVSQLAEDLVTSSRRMATAIENKEMPPQKTTIDTCITNIKEIATTKVKELPAYEKIDKTDRTLDDVKDFGIAINEQIEIVKSQLASDLSLEIPNKENAEAFRVWQDKSNNLPGLINGLFIELEKPLKDIFISSMDMHIPSIENIQIIEIKLNDFEKKAKEEIHEFLNWSSRKLKDNLLGLKLNAAKHLIEESNACPVCTQSLNNVPKIKEELAQLKMSSTKEYLYKESEDFWRYLAEELNKIISLSDRKNAAKSFATRIIEDWKSFKKTHCKELLLQIAERYDKPIESLTHEISNDIYSPFEIITSNNDEIDPAFSQFREEVNQAKAFIILCKCINSNKEKIFDKIMKVLVQSENGDAFKDLLERAKTNNESLKCLLDIHKQAGTLWKSTKEASYLKSTINALRNMADNAESVKALKENIRDEIKLIVTGQIGQKTKIYYEKLYDRDILEFNQLTTGHAENPDIKSEINLYLKAGEYQVPMEPYSNAGRMRALLLSFVFALLEKSSASLNFLILDDPALSLDDEHKVRFVDHLVEPLVKDGQVILGTHYQSFFDKIEDSFKNDIKLSMVPRKRVSDQTIFEPGDLLEKVEKALNEQSGNWKEIAGNLRIWIERVLGTLSGYCAEPFIIFNDIKGSIHNYSTISASGIASPKRDNIVTAFRSRSVQRIIHKVHHNEIVLVNFRIILGCWG